MKDARHHLKHVQKKGDEIGKERNTRKDTNKQIQ